MTRLNAANNALHEPVFLRACVDLFAPILVAENTTFIDCTLGMGGHTEAILDNFPNVRVIGIDRDPQALELSQARLERFGARFQAVHTTYDHVNEVAREYGLGGKVNAILMDLGISSLQVDEVERGFSYSRPAPLDMRMDTSTGVSARELLADISVSDLIYILKTYGQERYAKWIATAIVRYRDKHELKTTDQLAQIVSDTVPRAMQANSGHPAKRTFQAIRIAVNNELQILQTAVPQAIDALAVGGRLVVESYHSLEDRIVKQALMQGTKSATPLGLPLELEDHQPFLQLLVKGAVQADEQEISYNPRSASVRLRAVEKLKPTPKYYFDNLREQNYEYR